MKWLLAKLLKTINPKKPLGTKLFNAVARLTVTPTLEAVILREGGGGVEVLLVQRSPNDASFPNMWHVPGTVIRPGETFEASLKRMAESELGAQIESYEMVGLTNNLVEPRGHFISPIMLVKLKQEPKIGKWLNVKNLDETVIDFHKNLIIPTVLEYYLSPTKTPVKVFQNN